MSKFFISYRRDDSQAIAGRVFDRLSTVLPKRDIFFDVSTIEGGEQFEERTWSSIDRADVVLAIVGPSWLTRSRQGDTLRICQPKDYVGLEIARALKKGKLIIPVLIDNTSMPDDELLPEKIKPFTKCHALRLRHETFDADLDVITMAGAGFKLTDALVHRERSIWRKVVRAFIGSLIASGLLVVAAIVHNLLLGLPVSETIGSGATNFLLVIIPVIGAAAGWKFARTSQAMRRS